MQAPRVVYDLGQGLWLDNMGLAIDSLLTTVASSARY